MDYIKLDELEVVGSFRENDNYEGSDPNGLAEGIEYHDVPIHNGSTLINIQVSNLFRWD